MIIAMKNLHKGIGIYMNDNKSAYNAKIYDEHIVNVLPYYTEYSSQVIDLVRNMEKADLKWLDTGCGTGTLVMRAREVFPEASFTLCDPSSKMLDEAKEKLKGENITFNNISSSELEYDSEFDVLTAIQCHHYYNFEEREEATRRCFNALRESGIYITFENIRMSTDASDEIALDRWVTFLREHGNSEDEVQMHLNRRGVETHPITIEQHLDILKKCGFTSVNLLWASYLQAGFWAIK